MLRKTRSGVSSSTCGSSPRRPRCPSRRNCRNTATGKESKVEIKGHSGLSKDEIERMKKDAEAHAAEDKKRREFVDLRKQPEAATLPVEKELQEHGDRQGEQGRNQGSLRPVEGRD